MSIESYAHVENGVVVNRIAWDGVSPFSYQDKVVRSDIAQIGDTYEDGKFYYLNSEGVKTERGLREKASY